MKKTLTFAKQDKASEMIPVKKKSVRNKEDIIQKGNREVNGWKFRIFLSEGKNIQVIFAFSYGLLVQECF